MSRGIHWFKVQIINRFYQQRVNQDLSELNYSHFWRFLYKFLYIYEIDSGCHVKRKSRDLLQKLQRCVKLVRRTKKSLSNFSKTFSICQPDMELSFVFFEMMLSQRNFACSIRWFEIFYDDFLPFYLAEIRPQMHWIYEINKYFSQHLVVKDWFWKIFLLWSHNLKKNPNF